MHEPARVRRGHPSRKGAVPRQRNHQGRRLRVLRGRRAGDAAARPTAPGHDGALPGRHRQEGLHPEGRREGVPRAGSSGSRSRAATKRPAASSTTRWRTTRGRWSGWRTRTRSRRTSGRRGRRTSITPTSACSTWIRPKKGSDHLAEAALCVRDLLAELELPAFVKTSGAKGFHIVVALEPETDFGDVFRFSRGAGAVLVETPPGPVHAGVHQVRPRGTHLRRHGPERAGRDVRGGLRRAGQAGRAGVCALHLGRDRGRGGLPAHVHLEDDGRAPGRPSATSGRPWSTRGSRCASRWPCWTSC